MKKIYFNLSKVLAVAFVTTALFACRSHVPTERVTYAPPPPVKQEQPVPAVAVPEAPPAEDIPPLDPRKPAGFEKPSLIPPPPITLAEEWLVVVKKGKRKLHLYRDCRLVKTFPIDLGENPKGAKLHQGDMRTPEGLYRVVEKKDRGQTKYYLALLLDYPNDQDRVRYEAALKKGKISPEAGIGGLIEIHGEGRGQDWTQGCVALFNNHMTELFLHIPQGTPVWIAP